MTTAGWSLLAVLLAAGCSSSYWTKPGVTDAEFYRDSHACAQEASPSRDAPGVERLKISEDLYRGCLLDRGYWREKYFIRPTPSWRGLAE